MLAFGVGAGGVDIYYVEAVVVDRDVNVNNEAIVITVDLRDMVIGVRVDKNGNTFRGRGAMAAENLFIPFTFD